FHLLFRFRYLIHSNQLQSGLKTSSDHFGFILPLWLLFFKPRGGLADTIFMPMLLTRNMSILCKK
ncbi:MAG: hypothetical protein MSR67_05790, partial [Oscillospiraceae bacterium]|nr:hypothetical protein [Oscillospiraceae bacterium]